MYDAVDVCNYVINYCNAKKYGISNLKLQKILYFIQAYFLIEKSQKCFINKIVAWGCGPVVPEAYHKFKKYGGCNIYSSEFGNYNRISKEDKECINKVIEKFRDYSSVDLTNLTLNQAPWINAYNRHVIKEITPDLIKEYFAEERGKI